MPQTPRSDRATTRKPETAPPRIATWTASTRLRRAAEAVRTFALTLMYMPMIPEAIEQAAPTRKAIAGPDADGAPASDGTSATSAVSTSVMTTPMTTAPTRARMRDRRVLAADERDRALEDRAGDVLHRLRPGVARQDVAGEVEREQDGDDAGGQDDQLERTGVHRGCRVLLEAREPRSGHGAHGVRRFGMGDRGEVAEVPRAFALGWNLAGRRRV